MLPIRSRRTRVAFAALSTALILTLTPAAVASATDPDIVEVAGYDGQNPYSAAMSSDGTTLYVPNHRSDSVSVIDVNAMRQTGTISGFTGVSPFSITISPDGSFAYVAGDRLYVIDLGTNTQVGVVSDIRAASSHIGFSADGTRAYVTDGFNQYLHVIDTATHTRTAVISGFTGYLLAGVAESPDGSVVFVANYGSNTVQVVDPRTNRVTGRIANYTGRVPGTVTFSLDGATAFVTNEESHSVSVIDVATRTEVASIPVDEGASRSTLTADGAYLFVATPRSGTVTMVDTAARTSLGALPGYVGSYPRGVALSADEKSIFVAENVGNKVVRVPVPPVTATITAMTPDRATTTGDVEVTITGERLTGATAVTFGGTPGHDLQVAGDGTALTVTAPAHAVGNADVVVVHPRGNASVAGGFTYFTVPDAPTNVRVKPGDGTVALTWDAPESDGGAPVTGYVVLHALAGSDDWTTVADAGTTSATVTALFNEQEYVLRVAAENEAGVGAHHEMRAQPGTPVVDPEPSPSPSPTSPTTGGGSALAATGVDSTPVIAVGVAALLSGMTALLIHAIRRHRSVVQLEAE